MTNDSGEKIAARALQSHRADGTESALGAFDLKEQTFGRPPVVNPASISICRRLIQSGQAIYTAQGDLVFREPTLSFPSGVNR